MRSIRSLILCLFSLLLLNILPVSGQECSTDKKCATGCCSQFGFCGTTPQHCGAGCLSTCDFKLGCDASNPCKDGTCCSKFGFCGIGQDYCSPGNCAPGTVCTAKAQCDPGGLGSAYVELAKCPLNVCCSKWGYCGTTKEFCGDRTVTRPSCDLDSNSVQRVVGYYEGWAARRSCQAFTPEDIPLGVYTHLNFAFASVDPNTFQVVPAEAGDVGLYSRLTALKKQDPSLKVFIAIGGWAFNDPGPTASVFSTLAADAHLQQVFFASLISFMTTYNFDGVDIDWEYPGADDCSGRAVDFANFPSFIKNLKAALASGSGGRDSLTVTLPVSFWYLQHFDIVNLELWVDFFNIMSYDLHSLWDKGNKWLGPFLNSHTNLTEIEEYMDLFWRNGINPSKLNLGLAFYSRTFIASSPSCLQPACTFDAVGEAGPCSKDDIGGSLTNAELTEQINNAGVSRTLDTAAAVKIAVLGRKWITYDDQDTWQLKIDWARKLCFGGVMVWAVSQDYPEGKAGSSNLAITTYSRQLQQVTKYKSPTLVTNRDTAGGNVDEPSPNILRNQCYWANCGANCATGYSTVVRSDTDRKNDQEIMLDNTNCRGGQARVFCCPSAQTIPKCGWFDFNNGNCGKNTGSICPAGGQDIVGTTAAEVGSLSNACHSGKAQVACCETFNGPQGLLDSVMGYDLCVWHGTPPDCGISAYDYSDGSSVSEICSEFHAPRSYYLTDSLSGSGAESCYTGGLRDPRPYCCKAPLGDTQWRNCKWVSAHKNSDGWCEAYCPAGTVRLAMEDVHYGCNGGALAYCCEPLFRSEAKNSDEIHAGYVESLGNVIEKGCKWNISQQLSTITKRAIDRTGNETTAIAQRDDKHIYAEDYHCRIALAGTLILLLSNNPAVVQPFSNNWNLVVEQKQLYNIPATRIRSPSSPVQANALGAPVQTLWAEEVLNGVKDLNQQKTADACDWIWDLSYATSHDDPDDGGIDEGYLSEGSRKRSLSRIAVKTGNHYRSNDGTTNVDIESDHEGSELERRVQTGAARQFVVRSRYVSAWSSDTITSTPYPNGNQGDDLLSLISDNHRYSVASRGCGPTQYTLNIYTPKGVATPSIWVSEHILELQTIPRFLTAILDGRLEKIKTFPGLPAQYLTQIPVEVVRKLITPFTEFQNRAGSSLSPAELALLLCGSEDRPEGMVVAHTDLNQKKTLIFDFSRPVADDTWLLCCGAATRPQVESGFKHIQETMGVFSYWDATDVNARHTYIFHEIMQIFEDFEEAYEDATLQPISGEIQIVFKQFYKAHIQRVQIFARAWVQDRLSAIEAVWNAEFQSATTDVINGVAGAMVRVQDAIRVFGLVYDYRKSLEDPKVMSIDLTRFY